MALEKVVNNEHGNIFEKGLVSLRMDSDLFDLWHANGALGTDIRAEQQTKRIYFLNSGASIDNISFYDPRFAILTLEVNFYTSDSTNAIPADYKLRFIAKDHNTSEVLNGETFIVERRAFRAFKANAGADKYVLKHTVSTLQTNESASEYAYVLKVLNNDVIYTGQEVSITADTDLNVELSVVENLTGHIAKYTCTIHVIEGVINALVPNPAVHNVRVQSQLFTPGSGQILIVNSMGFIVKNITVSPSHTQSNITLSDINIGTYTVLLLANGKVLDTANLINQ